MQPLLFLVVFGFLLPKMNFVGKGYQTALLPGILALSLSLVGDPIRRAADGAGLRLDEGDRRPAARARADAPHRGREDRSGDDSGSDCRGGRAAGRENRDGPDPRADACRTRAQVLLVVLLGSAAFSSLGMWLGTAIAPQQIGLMFSVIVAPMLFFGCAYYPWRGLDVVPVMKYLVLVNPMVYVAEGMRGALTPSVPHMPLVVVGVALLIVVATFWTLGIRSFYRRAIG